MKPFAAIDLTNDKKNETANGMEFCCAKPSDALVRAFQNSSVKVEENLKRAKLPLPLRILEWVCTFVGLTTFIGILKGLGNGASLSTAYNNGAWIFWLCGGSLLAWGVLKFMGHKYEKAVLETDDSTQAVARMEGLCEAIFTELGVPAGARETDIFSFFYKEKDGKLKHMLKGTTFFNYMNLVYRVFADDENLYLANLDGKFVFPKASLKAIRTIKTQTIVATWQKDVPCNEGFYKQFKLQEDDNGCVHMKSYHILELEKDGTTWSIYFPCYELVTFEVLTGLKAE